MDKIDKQILNILQKNARTTNSEIARQVGMVPSGVLERIRKLEESGLIREYTASLKPEKVNRGLLAFIYIKTTDVIGSWATAEKLASIPEIQEVHHVAGEDCYLIKVRVSDNLALANLMREKLSKVKSVTSSNTTIVLETVKETSQLYIEETDD